MRGRLVRDGSSITLTIERCPICLEGHTAAVEVFEQRILIDGHDHLCYSLCPNSNSKALALRAIEGDEVMAAVVETPQGILRKSK